MDNKPRKPTPEERQAALNNISDEDLAKIQKLTSAEQKAVKVDDEWLILAEFGKHYGWQAYLAAKNNEISTEEMMTLIAAARKLDYLDLYMNARAVFIGAGSVQAKKPSDAFVQLTRDLIKETKADE